MASGFDVFYETATAFTRFMELLRIPIVRGGPLGLVRGIFFSQLLKKKENKKHLLLIHNLRLKNSKLDSYYYDSYIFYFFFLFSASSNLYMKKIS